MRNYYVKKQKNTPEELIAKGTRYQGIVISVKRRLRKGYCTTVCCERMKYTQMSKKKPSCGVGALVDIYVDEVDADGEYYIDLH